MIFSAVIFWIGMSLVAGVEDAGGLWSEGIPMVILFEGLIMVIVNGVKTIMYSLAKGQRPEIRVLISGGNSCVAIVGCVCGFIRCYGLI